MEQRIVMYNQEVAYTLKRSMRARHMRLTVYQGGKVVVTIPRGVDERMAERFVASKLQWILTKPEYFKRLPTQYFIPRSKGDFLKHQASARALVEERIAYFNERYHLGVKKITIKNQKTLWGSCSKKGDLNFNYKIVFLPSALADYIIVHEVCHLREFSHAKKFWNFVARTIPDYRAMRRALRKNLLLLS